MTDNELLLAISNIMDKKLEPIQEQLEEHTKKFETLEQRFDARMDTMDRRLKKVELCQENVALPRLQNIEACYTSTYERYKSGIAKIDAMQADIAVIKSGVSEHGKNKEDILGKQV